MSQALAEPLVVRVVDPSGELVAGVSVTWVAQGEGVALFRAVQQLDLEEIVAKREADPYGSEARWLKIKNRAYTQMEGRPEFFHPRYCPGT